MSHPGEGTTVKMFLPRTTEMAAPPTESQRPAAPAGAALVLVVDDEREVRAVTAQMLRERGHRVLEAGNGSDALRILATEPDLRLAVLDYAMPGMNGLELCWRMRLRRPGLPILFVTGYSDMNALADEPASDVLRKPFRAEELASRTAVLLRFSRSEPRGETGRAHLGMASP